MRSLIKWLEPTRLKSNPGKAKHFQPPTGMAKLWLKVIACFAGLASASKVAVFGRPGSVSSAGAQARHGPGSGLPAGGKTTIHAKSFLRSQSQQSELPDLAREMQQALQGAAQGARAVLDSGATAAERALQQQLAQAMSSPSTVAKADRESVSLVSEPACAPDPSKCPVAWVQRGLSCQAPEAYRGPCPRRISVNGLSIEQTLAMAAYCDVDLPCKDCAEDFTQPCPSLWIEGPAGVCIAPPGYRGPCDRQLAVGTLSKENRSALSIRCMAPWPCPRPATHDFRPPCPGGWQLEAGALCKPPAEYQGPCTQLLDTRGAPPTERMLLEDACQVSWPSAGTCEPNYLASCPAGWLALTTDGHVDCLAPPGFTQCRPVMSFSRLSARQKEAWAQRCGQSFPCISRDSCETAWSSPCPAGWFTAASGSACLAPDEYPGPCKKVLLNVASLTNQQKANLAQACALEWPCVVEVAGLSQSFAPGRGAHTAPFSVDGPVFMP